MTSNLIPISANDIVQQRYTSPSPLPYELPPTYDQATPSISSSDPNLAADQFNSLRISDPIPRGSSAMSYKDPIPRTNTSMSMQSPQHPHPQPRHQNTMPLLPNRHPRPSNPDEYQYGVDAGSQYSGNSGGSRLNNRYGDPSGSYDTSLQTDRSSYHSIEDQAAPSSDGYSLSTSRGAYPAYTARNHPQQAWQGSQPSFAPSPGHSGVPRPGEYNNLYAAASDVLGMGPPPQVGPGPVPSAGYPTSVYSANYSSLARQNTTMSSSPSLSFGGAAPGPSAYRHGSSLSPFPAVASSAASLMSKGDSTSSGASTIHPPDDDEFNLRPALQRHGTSLAVQTRKSKAVDLTAPPYTKEYIDQYRHRIKADPDPEAHFLYAKYLIDAAKKIGADTKDQRAVKKYRDMLITESLKVVRRLATQGEAFAEAQFFLANCYGTGMLGLQVDHERAYHLYLQAAKQNHAAASYRVAVCNEIGAGTRREPPRAAAFYRKAASLGDTPAMYKLGMILLHGTLGEMKNPREAINWLKRAAEQADEENPHALHELGLLHELPNSQLVAHDPAYAKALFMQAAHLGYTQSQYKLGQCFEYGALTCPVDPRRSIAWYTKAAEKGDSEAELALSGWYLTGSEGVLKQSDSEAYLWARRAANKGLNKAEYAVGYYAEVGIGIKQDIEFAKRWYMRAAGMLFHIAIQLNNSHPFLSSSR
jgi:uncharacterized protein